MIVATFAAMSITSVPAFAARAQADSTGAGVAKAPQPYVTLSDAILKAIAQRGPNATADDIEGAIVLAVSQSGYTQYTIDRAFQYLYSQPGGLAGKPALQSALLKARTALLKTRNGTAAVTGAITGATDGTQAPGGAGGGGATYSK
jgi:hypothetical protein